MISPAALKKYGKEIGFHPVGTGPYKLDTWNQTDFVKVKKFAGYWQPGLPKLDSITWRPVVDNNTRAAMLQTGEAQFAFRSLTSRRRCWRKTASWSWWPARRSCSATSA
jgi:glutathione transport system substrate-binding protein